MSLKLVHVPIVRVAIWLLTSTCFLGQEPLAFAACGATTRTWDGSNSTVWTTNQNWSGNNHPNTTTENAVMTSQGQTPAIPNPALPIACLQVSSGTMNATGGGGFSISGDYFQNLNLGSIISGSSYTVTMSGTAAQTFENVDPIGNLVIANSTSVALTETFTITNALTINAGSGTVYIDNALTLSNTATALTIPASATIEIRSGGILNAEGGIVVNGVLKINGGGKLIVGDQKTLTVASGGVLVLAGAPGNVAVIDAGGGKSYSITVNGSINMNYFTMSRCRASANGLDIFGSIQTLSNGEFHYLNSGGAAVTLESSTTSPATWANIGFFDDKAEGNITAINAANYNGTAISLTNWSGMNTENDPNGKITFSVQAATALILSDSGPGGTPATTLAAGTVGADFGAFGFALNQTSTATDITSLKFTLAGNNVSSDVSYIQVFYNGGVCNPTGASQVGANTAFSGTPPTATVAIPPGAITIGGTTKLCVYVRLTLSSSARTNDTIGVQIASTADVANSQNYSFSVAGGPPVTLGITTVTGGSTLNYWTGNSSTAWATVGNWSTGAAPTTTTDCQIGRGARVPVFSATSSCQNATLPTGGSLSWKSTANIFNISGSLSVGTGYTFTTATAGVINFNGASDQSVDFQTTFPGNVTVNNTGGNVLVNSNWTINGNLTLTAGTLVVVAGRTLTLGQNITVNGGTLLVQPGATLKLSNNSTFTVASGGTLSLVGDTTQNSVITSTGTTASYSVTVSGTINARYYSFSNLGLSGLTINSGATINATNYLQNGTFSYPIGTNAILLTLNQPIPGNALSNMTFDSGGSTFTGTKGIKTNTTAGTLVISSYSGTLTGTSNTTVVGSYNVSWLTPTNTLKLTQEATSPSTVNQGETYTMGRFGLQQTQAGSFLDTDLTSLKITLTGSGSATDVAAVRIYYDSGCTGSSGTLLGTGALSGAPASVNFTGLSGATIQASESSPPKRFIYVQYDISSSATSGATLGAQIASVSDQTNSQSYAFNGSYAPPLGLGAAATVVGTTSTWTGATSNNWYTATNWNTGVVPTASTNCVINTPTVNPVIGTGTAVCKSLTNGNGTITMTSGSGAVLEIYGDLTNTGTIIQNNQTIRIRDNGTTATTQTIQMNGTLDSLVFNKTAGGYVYISDSTSLAVNTFTMGAGNNFTFKVRTGTTLVTSGATVTSSILLVDGAGTIKFNSGSTFLVNGGTFRTTGVNDAFPQSITNKSIFTNNGGTTTWSFNATSGTVDLTGFLFEWLDTNGLTIGGTTVLSHLDGGQLRNLSTNYTNVKAIQINTTGSIPSSASNIGWNWGPNNTPPPTTTAYYLTTSTGCGGQTLSFDQWFGDFFVAVNDPPTASKVNLVNCNVSISAAASPVSLTQFKATPFLDSVILNWTTGLEVLHQGFNVYRSLSPQSGYVQMNPLLLRNPSTSSTVHGEYEFRDTGIIAGLTYYYKIEDFSTSGARTMHGPVSATPMTSLGTTPSSPLSTQNPILGASQEPIPAVSPNDPFTAGQSVLSAGVTQIAQTRHSLRVRIDVPNYTTHPAEVAPYERVTIPGYAGMAQPGLPDLPERIIMLQIPPSTSASYSIVNSQSNSATPHNVAPALQWTQTNNTLSSSWVLNSSVYNTNQMSPSSNIILGDITQSSGLYYLPVIVHPLTFNPVTQQVVFTHQITLDISLNGAPQWGIGTSLTESGPWGFEGSLQIRIKKEGLYQISYDDMVAAGVIGPFLHADVNKFHLYSRGNEIPIEIIHIGAQFASGDFLRFYAPYFDQFDTPENTLLLLLSPTHGLRMSSWDASGSGVNPRTQVSFLRPLTLKESHFAYFGDPLGEELNHIFWSRIYSPPTHDGDDIITAQLDLPHFERLGGTVSIQAYFKGRAGTHTQNVVHHIQVFVNGSSNAVGDSIFDTQELNTSTFNIPATYFVPGANQIQFKVVGDLSNGDYDIVSLDHFSLTYPHNWTVDQDQLDAPGLQANRKFTLTGFSGSDILLYDISNTLGAYLLTNGTVGPDGQGGQQIQFASSGTEGSANRRILAIRSSAVPKPHSILLNPGSNLHAVQPGADVVFVGPAALLPSIHSLAQLRVQQGFRVSVVDLNQVYLEFGQGIPGSQALKDFVQFAYTQWQAPHLRYLILVGDGSYDPKGELGFDTTGQVPIYLLKGAYADYASDNWFAAFNFTDRLPSLSVGRIPGATPQLITTYVNKVLAYEAGTARPSGNAASIVGVIADEDQLGGEQFSTRAQLLSRSISFWNNSIKTSEILRDHLTSTQMKSSIISAFNSGNMFIHYLGHGAEDLWADGAIFQNSDADALTNPQLPIVVAMNCLNGYFYHADVAYQSLADRLIFNEQGGAIAMWASTSLSSPDVQQALQNSFYQTVATHPGIRLGDAILAAKVVNGWSLGNDEVISSWTLLGDPMIRILIPSAQTQNVTTSPAPSTPNPSQANHSPSNNDSASGKHSGGLFGCGTVSTGPKDPPSGGGLMIAGFTLLLLYLHTHSRAYPKFRRKFRPV